MFCFKEYKKIKMQIPLLDRPLSEYRNCDERIYLEP